MKTKTKNKKNNRNEKPRHLAMKRKYTQLTSHGTENERQNKIKHRASFKITNFPSELVQEMRWLVGMHLSASASE